MSSHYETHGFFEDLYDPTARKVVGTRRLSEVPPGRRLGAGASVEVRFTEDFEVRRGEKTILVRCKRPLTLLSTINTICGRSKFEHPFNPK